MGEEDTRALPAVWERASEFRGHIENVQRAAANLASAARSGDGTAIDDARGVVGQTCQGCNRDFRARPAR